MNWSQESYPEDLQFEALVDVLRGRVKVNIHCYEAGKRYSCNIQPEVNLFFSRLGWDCSGTRYLSLLSYLPDLAVLVQLTNEFQFPVAAFHHAHEAYLVPDMIKNAWGKVPPAVALFATNARYVSFLQIRSCYCCLFHHPFIHYFLMSATDFLLWPIGTSARLTAARSLRPRS